jgi:DNA-binding response OmpR family regulator
MPTLSTRQIAPVEKEVPRSPAMNILVIDDDQRVRDVIAEYLRFDGHEVDLADGPTAGLGKIKASRYDLVITDRAMPEMSGDRLALEAKRLSPHLPILMLSGFGEFMIARGEHPEGVDAVVAKPITANALRDAIAAVTRRPAA